MNDKKDAFDLWWNGRKSRSDSMLTIPPRSMML